MDAFKELCFLCHSEFNFARGAYHGAYIPLYAMSVCDTCFSTNWDGWAPHYDDKILRHLQEKGMTVPDRNEKGWLPRGR